MSVRVRRSSKHGMEFLCNLVVGFLSSFVKVHFVAFIHLMEFQISFRSHNSSVSVLFSLLSEK